MQVPDKDIRVLIMAMRTFLDNRGICCFHCEYCEQCMKKRDGVTLKVNNHCETILRRLEKECHKS